MCKAGTPRASQPAGESSGSPGGLGSFLRQRFRNMHEGNFLQRVAVPRRPSYLGRRGHGTKVEPSTQQSRKSSPAKLYGTASSRCALILRDGAPSSDPHVIVPTAPVPFVLALFPAAQPPRGLETLPTTGGTATRRVGFWAPRAVLISCACVSPHGAEGPGLCG